ncbi:SusD/RagB family nutrient-binding outer membrane lipoprotein [Pontibacter sp. H249]|uniref:SusD/RagB family nutrient-binding outer membrane lipoprotein n=1 Tax=Pontibacter sp. H249 TaxID=3133420 RepID=UPI0030BB4BC8
MKKLLAIFIVVVSVFACTDDFEEMNVDPKTASGNVPANTLFSNAQKNLTDIVTSSNQNLNIFRLLAQYWTQTTYTDESRYDLSTRNIPQNFWNILYRDVLSDLRQARDFVNTDPDISDAQRANQLAMIEIIEIYTWAVLVNTYGDIPYTEALNIENVVPVYDDDAAIYNSLLTRIDAAINSLDPAATGFTSSDLLYGGNISQWVKFGNSLKLKLGMTIADVNSATAAQVVAEAAPNVFESNEDNSSLQYLATPPNTNPIWVDLVQSGRRDFVAANTIVDVMNDLNDPRRDAYFTTVANDDDEEVFRGGIYGRSNSYSLFSKPDEQITSPVFEGLLLDYAEVEFFLAEAAARGYIAESPAEHYRQGISASMEYWGVENAEITAYLTRPEILADLAALAVGAGTISERQKQAIGTQKWLALYNRGHEGWTEWRRLDYPQLQPADPAILPAIPVRFPYPVQEQNLNTANYNAASGAIGGDLPSTRVFWDID